MGGSCNKHKLIVENDMAFKPSLSIQVSLETHWVNP